MYVISLDFHNAYVTLDRYRCLGVLVVYVVGYRARRILREYWDRLQMVAGSEGYYSA